MTMPATPMAIRSQANQSDPPLEGFPLVWFLALALLKVPPRIPCPRPNLVYLEQLDRFVIDRADISDGPRKQARWRNPPTATNKKHDRSNILVVHDSMAVCLIGYILASLTEDFK